MITARTVSAGAPALAVHWYGLQRERPSPHPAPPREEWVRVRGRTRGGRVRRGARLTREMRRAVDA